MLSRPTLPNLYKISFFWVYLVTILHISGLINVFPCRRKVHSNICEALCWNNSNFVGYKTDNVLKRLGKIFSRQHFEIFLLFFQENVIWYFMQIVSNGDNLHEMSNSVF